jgi:hypothetical protein
VSEQGDWKTRSTSKGAYVKGSADTADPDQICSAVFFTAQIAAA